MKTLNQFKSKIKSVLCIVSVSFFSTSLSAQDHYGNSSVQSDPCIATASPWYLGGNLISAPAVATPFTPPPATDIGTCNNFNFVLKANNFPSVWVTPGGRIGINNSAPAAALDVKSPGSSSQSSFRIYGDAQGNLESTTDINMNFGAGNSLFFNEGPTNAGNNLMTIASGGNVGIGSSSPLCKLEVRDAANTNIYAFSTNANGTAGLWALNGTTNYGLRIDANSIGHITQSAAGPIDMLNFTWNSVSTKAQVWVGKRPTTGTHSGNFDFAAPKIVSNEIFVFTTGTWADYVFDANYALPSLTSVESYYKKNHHLPEVPSAAEVSENGISVGQMDAILLKKIEELTLYVVAQQKEIDQLKAAKK